MSFSWSQLVFLFAFLIVGLLFLFWLLHYRSEYTLKSYIKNFLTLDCSIKLGHTLVAQLQKRILDNSFAVTENYKFYGVLIRLLCFYCAEFGLGITQSLQLIRQGLLRDLKFQKKVQGEKTSLNLQLFLMYLIISLLAWHFGLNLKKNIYHHWLYLSLYLMICVLGLKFSFNLITRRYFIYYEHFYFTLYHMLIFSQLDISLSKIFRRAKIKELFEIRNEKFAYIQQQIGTLCEQMSRQGGAYQKEWLVLLDELYFLHEGDFEACAKKYALLKVLGIFLFFIAYLVLMMSFIQDMIA